MNLLKLADRTPEELERELLKSIGEEFTISRVPFTQRAFDLDRIRDKIRRWSGIELTFDEAKNLLGKAIKQHIRIELEFEPGMTGWSSDPHHIEFAKIIITVPTQKDIG